MKTAMIMTIGINMTPTIITKMTKYTKNIIQKAINRTMGVDISTNNKNKTSVIISKGTPIITNNPKTKKAPNIINAVPSASTNRNTLDTPNPIMPLKNMVANATKFSISKLGRKNNSEGIAYSTVSANVKNIHNGKNSIKGIKVKKFQIHHRGHVTAVMGHIQALSISPIGIYTIIFKGQKFHIILTS